MSDRALLAEPLGAEMGEQAEAVVITPAMLKEEEQLEAAGLEQERQMLEKVRAARGRPAPPGGRVPAGGGVCRGAWGPGPRSSLGFTTNKRERLVKAMYKRLLIIHRGTSFFFLFLKASGELLHLGRSLPHFISIEICSGNITSLILSF